MAWRIQCRFRPDPDQRVGEGIVNPQEVRSTICTQRNNHFLFGCLRSDERAMIVVIDDNVNSVT